MVHVTDMKKITLMEQVADDYQNLGNEGQDQPIKPIQQQDPTEDTTAPAAPTEVEGPPSSCLRSKTKLQLITREQGQLECNPAQQGQLECNPAQLKVNTVEIAFKHYSLMQWTKTLLWAKRVSKHKAPVAARCTLMVAMAVYKLKCNQARMPIQL